MITEEVRGTIIGDYTYPYEFWTAKGRPHRIGRGFFANDEEAQSYAKAHYPVEYAQGIEMRCFNWE